MNNAMPDLTKLSWQLNIALAGGIFAVFALIYNDGYIELGFITFLFGVVGHFLDNIFSFLLEKRSWRLPLFYSLQAILIVAWISILLLIYFAKNI